MLSSILVVGLLALTLNLDDVIHISPAALLWFSLVGVVTYVLGRQFNYGAIRRIGAVRASTLFATAPFFALILAVSFLGEGVNLAIIMGTLTIVVGLYLVVTGQ